MIYNWKIMIEFTKHQVPQVVELKRASDMSARILNPFRNTFISQRNIDGGIIILQQETFTDIKYMIK